MICAIICIVILCIICFLLIFHIVRCNRQMKDVARLLEETSSKSNLRLYSGLRSSSWLRLCSAIDNRLEQSQTDRIDAKNSKKELQYLIACISHDIRTPLTSAIGYLQLMENCSDTDKRQKYQDIAFARLQDLSRMLDEFFLYSTLTNKPADIECQPVSFYQILCESLLEKEKAFLDAGQEPDIEMDDPDMKFMADPMSMKRVFDNLLSNALQYGAGNILIAQHENCVSFSNIIPPETQIDVSSIFTRFYRNDSARSSAHLGLGLSIVQQLMEGMGGSVNAKVHDNRLVIETHWK